MHRRRRGDGINIGNCQLIIKSNVNTKSSTYQSNFDKMSELVSDLKKKKRIINIGGSLESRKRHISRGKVLPRERIEQLLDDKDNALEIGQLAGYGLNNNETPSGSIVCVIGKVSGRDSMIIANDATVKGGTYFPITLKKHLRSLEIAKENNLACINLVDSGGANLREQTGIFADKEGFGRIFFEMANMSSVGIPQISAVLGSCTAGGAYIPAMSDETVIVKKNGTIFLGGPHLVKAATGEITNEQDLGGAELHTKLSGVADYFANDDYDALNIVKSIMSNLNYKKKYALNLKDSINPKYDPIEIYGILPIELKEQYDVREIIARLVDNSELDEFKSNYGTTLVTGFAHIMGIPIGIVANNGILFSESSLKATHFIQLCEQRGIPILFLQNIAGFMIGRTYEEKGIAKDGAKLVNAVSTVTVPKLTLIIGGSFGAGNYAMCGRAYSPRFLFSWPNSKISVMGGEIAAKVLSSVKEAQYEKLGKKWKDQKKLNFQKEIMDQFDNEGSPYYASARLWDDGILDPLETRKKIALGLLNSLNAKRKNGNFGIFRM
ncbi:MAG: carboxyl transferase domain-containing protein [Pseudomonadota bacterium]|nr:carboxyl transferase domain-containing protein [Pseudomonadota bacterium]